MEREPGNELMQVLAAYSPGVVEAFLATRDTVLEVAPQATEIVTRVSYTVSCGFTFTGSIKQAFFYVSAYSGHATLGFAEGAAVPDPDGLLKGDGSKMRHIRITDPAQLDDPRVRVLISEAAGRATRPVEPIAPTTRITRSKAAGTR